MNAVEYTNSIKHTLTIKSYITSFKIVRERLQDDFSWYRYRIRFDNGDLLEMTERFMVKENQIKVLKYSFHWQDTNGNIRKRWDNAPHHANLATFPHHVHDGSEENVLPHPAIMAEDMLIKVAELKAKLEKTTADLEK